MMKMSLKRIKIKIFIKFNNNNNNKNKKIIIINNNFY